MPAIRGPKALQDAWDSSKTVRQNYLALGLQHDLNPIPSGGFEVSLKGTRDTTNGSQSTVTSCGGDQPSDISDRPATASELPKGFGRIIRDSSGAVIGVELHDEEETERTPKQDVDIDEPVMSESELRIWAGGSCEEASRGMNSGDTDNTVVKDLEKLAASAHERQRHTSVGERLYLESLVNKYGDDFEKMARDRRFNPEQKTTGELKRAISKAGGPGNIRRVHVAGR
jgi:nucleolar protein 16